MQIEIPQTAKRIKIDVGLSYCAPNSSIWITDDSETFVIGIEPNKEAVERIKRDGIYSQQRVSNVPYNHSHFHLINGAVDNIDSVQNKIFYATKGDVGVSSLLKPTRFQLDAQYEVECFPLSLILKNIDWERFNKIDLLKIDTQGKDLDVIKSCGEWLDKIVYLHCEITTHGEYENEPDTEEYNQYLISKGFKVVGDGSIVNGIVVDRLYLNSRWSNEAENINPFVL